VGATEWSGRLVWRILEGTIEDPSSLVVEAIDIIPMDIGTPGFTEFETGNEAVEYFNKHPKLFRKVKMGLIHTHHTMGAYFSGTDSATMEEWSTKDGLFLSLIVNFKETPVAKIGFIASQKVHETVRYNSLLGEFSKFSLNKEVEKEEDVLMLIQMDIDWQTSKVEDDYFLEKLEAVKKAKASKGKKIWTPSYGRTGTPTGSYQNLRKTTGNSKVGKQLQMPMGHLNHQKNPLKGNAGVNEDGDRLILDPNGDPVPTVGSQYVQEEQDAFRVFAYTVLWGNEALPPREEIPLMDHEDFVAFCERAADDAVDDYTGGETELSDQDIKGQIITLKDNLDFYYQHAFYDLGDEYEDEDLQAAIMRVVAKTFAKVSDNKWAWAVGKLLEQEAAALSDLETEKDPDWEQIVSQLGTIGQA
jgi:hypothetical protein